MRAYKALENPPQNSTAILGTITIHTPDVIVLEYNVEYDLVDTHNWTERHYVRKKLLTSDGSRDNTELKINYNPNWESIELVRAVVINTEKIQKVGPEEIQLMDANWVALAPRYPGSKTLIVNFPALETGSIIEYEYFRKKSDRPFFSATHIFRQFDPIEHQTVCVKAPVSLGLNWIKNDNGVLFSDLDLMTVEKPIILEKIEERDNRIIALWLVESQPAVEQEDSLPPLYTFCPFLRITTGDWQTYSRELHTVLQNAVMKQSAAAKLAQEIVQGAKTEEDKIIAIRDFVAKNIRVDGPSCYDLPFDKITLADQTLSDGYGNTTDRAILLYTMLEAIELSPEFVIASSCPPTRTLQEFEINYPSLEFLNKVLVRLRHDKDNIYLNDTDHYAKLGTTPACDQLALTLSEVHIDTITIPDNYRDLVTYEYRIILTEGGNARIVVEQKSYGISFAHRRKLFAEMLPENRKQYYQKILASSSLEVVSISDLKADFTGYPGVERYSIGVEQYAVRDNNLLYFELPILHDNRFHLQSERRNFPFYHSQKHHVVYFGSIELPPMLSEVIIAPKDHEISLPVQGGNIKMHVACYESVRDNILTLDFVQEISLDFFIANANEYVNLLETVKRFMHPQTRTFLLSIDDNKSGETKLI